MQNSTLITWLSFANREPRIGQAILWSLLGCSWMLFTFPALSNLPYLLDGEIVQGRVVTAPVIDNLGGKFGPKYAVRFEYSDAAGNVHSGAGRVRSAGTFKPGDLIPARYLRSESARSRLDANVWDNLPTLAFSVVGFAIVVASAWHRIRGIRRVNSQVWPRQPAQLTVGSTS
jgi:hypothetical protein